MQSLCVVEKISLDNFDIVFPGDFFAVAALETDFSVFLYYCELGCNLFVVGYALGIEALYKAFNFFGQLNLLLVNNLEILDDVDYCLRVDECNLVCIVVARELVGNRLLPKKTGVSKFSIPMIDKILYNLSACMWSITVPFSIAFTVNSSFMTLRFI